MNICLLAYVQRYGMIYLYSRKEDTNMMKAFKYRLYPTRKQGDTLQFILDRNREIYNAALEERREAWRLCKVSVTFEMQSAQLPDIKKDCPEFGEIYAQILQETLHRVDKAFKAFFWRVKNGRKSRISKIWLRAMTASPIPRLKDSRASLSSQSKMGRSSFPRSVISKSNSTDLLKERSKHVLSSARVSTGMWSLPAKLRHKRSCHTPIFPSELTWD